MRDFSWRKEYEWQVREIVKLRRHRLVLVIMLLIMLAGLFAGCASSTYLADAQACGNGPECQELWDAWNKREELLLQREIDEQLRVEREAYCAAKGEKYVTIAHSKDWACASRADLERLLGL